MSPKSCEERSICRESIIRRGRNVIFSNALRSLPPTSANVIGSSLRSATARISSAFSSSWSGGSAARRFAGDLLSAGGPRRGQRSARRQRLPSREMAHGKSVLTMVWSIDASVCRPVYAIACTSSACMISRMRCTPGAP